MDTIEFRRFVTGDADALAGFLAAHEWPFHANPRVDPGAVRRQVADGYYDSPAARTFWVLADGEPVGVVRIFDLDDGAPLFDLRIGEPARGRGAGTRAVRWLTTHVFTEHPEVDRIEATTRQDNHAMRRVLRHCGYAKEAHYRQAWPNGTGTPSDAVGYAVLRGDWASGTVTPPDFDDEPA